MTQPLDDAAARAAIEQAMVIYERLQTRDQNALVQARKLLTQRIYGLIAAGESDVHQLVVEGLKGLKQREREHGPGRTPRRH